MRTIATVFALLLGGATASADPGAGILAGAGAEFYSRPVRVELTSTGYKVHLTAKGVERLHAALERLGDGKNLGDFLKTMSKTEVLDDGTQLRLQLMGLAVGSQLPSFRDALAKKGTENGAVVTMYGARREPKRNLRILRGIAGGVIKALPENLEGKANTALAVMRTDVLYWTVEGR